MQLKKSQESLQQRNLRAIEDRIEQKNIKPFPKKKTIQDSNLILSCLKNHFIFYNLSPEQLENVKENMFYSRLPQGAKVFEKDDLGTCFFIIQRGTVDIIVDGVAKKQLKPLDGFGELALLYNHQRTSSVQTKTQCAFWVIDKIGFREAVEQIVTKEYEENRKYLEGLKFFPFLSSDIKDVISASLVTLKYYKNQIIVEEGDPGSAFYIIKQGVASLIKGSVEQRKMYKGESFGEMSLYYNTMRKMTIKADDEVKCLVLGRETLVKILGQNFHSLMFKNFMKYSFQKNKTLSQLTKTQQDKIFDSMKITYYKANDHVFKKGTLVQKLITLFEGRLKKFKSPVVLANPGETWGEDYIERFKERIQDDIIAESDMVATEIEFEAISKSLGMTLIEAIRLNTNLNDRKRNKYEVKIKKQMANTKMNEFMHITQLGKLNYGSIHLVERKQSKFIAKVIQKKQLRDNSLQQFYKNESLALPQMQFPFIAQFYKTFEVDNCYINIFEYVPGMQLYDMIREIGLLSSRDCQFYVANMILILEYLQSKEIVIRDLKPENLIVDQRGYLKLVSFSSSKYIGNTHKTNTIIGTPHYMAPEMIQGKPYNQLVDLWAVGVMLYEFINGYLPFGAQTQNPFDIYEAILKGEITHPNTLKDKRAKKLIQELLSVNPQSRHGGSYANLKNNSWFETIIWQQLYEKNEKKLKPVEQPNIKVIESPLNKRTLQEYLQGF